MKYSDYRQMVTSACDTSKFNRPFFSILEDDYTRTKLSPKNLLEQKLFTDIAFLVLEKIMKPGIELSRK